MSNTGHDGTPEQVIFMEVDIVINKMNRDFGGITIKSRDIRNHETRDILVLAGSQLHAEGNIVHQDMESENIVIEAKRKRVTDNMKGDKEEINMDNQNNVKKLGDGGSWMLVFVP